jgi:protein-tyrosine-phosphatase
MNLSDSPSPHDRPHEEDGPPGGEPFRILFVCTGNTCRSPLAAALTRRGLQKRGWAGVEVRSAGAAAVPGAEASQGSLGAARRHGLDLESHRSQPLTPDLVQWADLILTMSASHLGPVLLAGGGDRAAVITEFAAGREVNPEAAERAGVPDSVPDPFGGDEEEYERTYRSLEDLVERILDRLAPVIVP